MATPPHIILLIRTVLELVPDDPNASAVVRDELTLLEDDIRQAIERGVVQGEISRKVDAIWTARTLLSLFLGTHLLMKAKPVLHATASQIGALLPPP